VDHAGYVLWNGPCEDALEVEDALLAQRGVCDDHICINITFPNVKEQHRRSHCLACRQPHLLRSCANPKHASPHRHNINHRRRTIALEHRFLVPKGLMTISFNIDWHGPKLTMDNL
jgi:hypothetical protein